MNDKVLKWVINGYYGMYVSRKKITIKKSQLKYCFKADSFYDFCRRVEILFTMKGFNIMGVLR